ncbi:MAG TPA: hypothetical protein VGB92_25820 [Longimicrobium sp.]
MGVVSAEEEVHLIVFEGFADTEPGWEFDMPVYMIYPVRVEGCGGNIGYAEDLVEDYLFELSCGNTPASEDGEWAGSMRQFRRARAGKGKPGRLVYWRQEVRITGGGIPDEDYTNVTVGPLVTLPPTS